MRIYFLNIFSTPFVLKKHHCSIWSMSRKEKCFRHRSHLTFLFRGYPPPHPSLIVLCLSLPSSYFPPPPPLPLHRWPPLLLLRRSPSSSLPSVGGRRTPSSSSPSAWRWHCLARLHRGGEDPAPPSSTPPMAVSSLSSLTVGEKARTERARSR